MNCELFTITNMAEPAKVDLVGVGLNATDTLIRITHFPPCLCTCPTPIHLSLWGSVPLFAQVQLSLQVFEPGIASKCVKQRVGFQG